MIIPLIISITALAVALGALCHSIFVHLSAKERIRAWDEQRRIIRENMDRESKEYIE